MKTYDVISKGKAHYHIVGANFSKPAERYAASELQKYIYDSTDTFIPYHSDRCARRSPEIIIGYKTRNAEELVTAEEIESLGEEGFIIKTLGEDILITGKTPRGTLYGAYEFLRRFIGFRAFTKSVEKYDRKEELLIPECNVREVPDFEYRDAYFRYAFDGAFCAKNRLNTTLGDVSAEKGGNLKFYNCHHSFEDLVPSKTYFDTHPEYYSERGGKRVARQLCLSNPDVLKISIECVKKWILENPECRVFSVAQSDNEDYCDCPACRRVDEEEGTHAGSVIRFVNKVAEAAESVRPDVLIHTFAYTYSRIAPKKTKPRENVIVRLCNIECEWGDPFALVAKRAPESASARFLESIDDWAKITDRLYVWDYSVNFRHYLMPFPNFYTLGENVRYYRDHGVKGLLEQGNFSYGGDAAMGELKSYIIANLAWCADTDVDGLIKEFTDGVYGLGAPYIREYIKLVSDAPRGKRMTLFDDPDAGYFDEALIERADELFRLAEAAAESDEVRHRIEREHLSVKYMKTVFIADDGERAREADRLYKEVKSFRLTEIMERMPLEDSFAYMKRSRFAKEQPDRVTLYYIVR
ncbi:MAG: DUF4838 domain-containing protein [Clostridia bacterium]|nr:DUF4838 domain-containing protein [Clostridia bacterium]